MRELKLVVLLVSVLTAVAGCAGPGGNGSGTTNTNKPLVSSANVAAANAASSDSPATAQLDGKEIFTESCKICHQATGKGGPTTVNGKRIKPADLTSNQVQKHSDDEIAKDISEGSPEDGMPAFKSRLKPEEIKAVVGYLRTLQQP